jgi:SAM-dependent methyltransferase
MAFLSPAGPQYDAEYYQWIRECGDRSAATVVPILIDVFRPRSVVDVGCGTGSWLSAFRRHGVVDALGVDGPWVPREQRQVPEGQFYEHDLNKPLRVGRSFDLALCLEVAEHLPPAAAGPLVEALTRLAPVVVFSAAIPLQGGEGHVNERWPTFWINLFAEFGFGCLDGLRHRVWTNDAVELWYRQNMLCYVAPKKIDGVGHSLAAGQPLSPGPLDLVHPQVYLSLVRDREFLRAELQRITESRLWRFYQTVHPILKAGKRIAAALHR